MSFTKLAYRTKCKKELTLVSSFLLLLCLLSPSAFAFNEHFIGLNAYLTNNNFSEKDHTKTLNTEQGLLTGLGLDWGYAVNHNWQLTGKLNQQNTKLDYQGFSQNGLAIKTQTYYQQQDFELAARYIHQQYFASIGISHSQHQRNIKSINEISGLNETYQFNFVSIGLGWQHTLTQALKLELSANYAYAAKSNLTVDFLKLYDKSNNSLNKVTRAQISAQLAYALSQYQQLLFVLQHQQIHIAQSDQFILSEQGKHRGFFYQPQRQLSQNTVIFSYRWNW